MLSQLFESLPAPAQRKSKIALASIGRRIHITANGALLFDDIRRRLKNERFEVIFDVGANVGQSAKNLTLHYSGSRIYSFEPAPNTFKTLQRAVKSFGNTVAVNLGMGDKPQTVRFDDRGPSDMARIGDQSDETLPRVEITTVDDYCSQNGIHRIDYLKIDTEGNDLNVLKGAIRMLSDSRISVIVVECSMNPDNKRHVPFNDFYQYLCPMGYRVFGLYEQVSEFIENKPHLRRSNVVYISREVIRRN